MEILQRILIILTNESEVLTKIICAPLTFIEAYISVLIFTTILKIPTNKKKNILYTLLFSYIALINLFFIPSPYYTFLNVLICPILVLLLFKTTVLKSILSEFVIYVIFILFGSILIGTYVLISKNSSDVFIKIPIYKMSYSIILYLVVFLFYILCRQKSFSISLLDKMKKINNRILLINFFIGTFAIITQAYLVNVYSNYIPLFITCLSMGVLLIYFIFSLYSLSRTTKLEITTQDLEEQKLYNKTLTILHDNIRGFKHDFNNIVQAIGGYISTDNMDGLKVYYSDLLGDCQKVNNLSMLNPELINNPAIYSLLTSKYHKADASRNKN